MNHTQLYDRPKVGGDVLSSCSKCKMDLAHVVMAMVDGKPYKVQCKTCRSEHRHKLTGTGSAPKKRLSLGSTQVQKSERVSMKASEYWEKLMAENGKRVPMPYSPKTKFSKNTLMDHPKFGTGLIAEDRGTKIVVIFKDGERILIHGI